MNSSSEPSALESAVPDYLRTSDEPISRWTEDNPPPYPTFVSRFEPGTSRVAMVYLGVQGKNPSTAQTELPTERLQGLLDGAKGLANLDIAGFRDALGCATTIYAAYWIDFDSFSSWLASEKVSRGWEEIQDTPGGFGFFREIYTPAIDGFEAHFSTHRPEGISVGAVGMSGPIREHAYWGSARDRIPRSQTQPLNAEGYMLLRPATGHSNTLRVEPHAGTCIIRSGQDWEDAREEELRLYSERIAPVLLEGMQFLEQEGSTIGCYSSRFVSVGSTTGHPQKKSYGVSIWRSLAHLEAWSSSHKTHLAIFGAGMNHMKKFGESAGLRTFHEVSVLSKNEQLYEYISCHPRTGLLNVPSEIMPDDRSSHQAVVHWLASLGPSRRDPAG